MRVALDLLHELLGDDEPLGAVARAVQHEAVVGALVEVEVVVRLDPPLQRLVNELINS